MRATLSLFQRLLLSFKFQPEYDLHVSRRGKHERKLGRAMQIEVTKKHFTVDEYERMAEVGILGPEERTELVDGEIIEMSPPGIRHASCCIRANTLFTEALGRRVFVSVQNPLRLDQYNQPQPDILVLKSRPDFYASRRPNPEDACLVVEISDSSLALDRKIKLRHYARTGVPEFWIEDLKRNVLLVFRLPFMADKLER